MENQDPTNPNLIPGVSTSQPGDTSNIAVHTHNGTDSLRIPANLTRLPQNLVSDASATPTDTPIDGTIRINYDSNGIAYVWYRYNRTWNSQKISPTTPDLSAFGGTGTDGAMNITNGTTTLNLNNASIFVRNYTSFSLTGTGQLAFTNPNDKGTLIIIRSIGAVTITSSSVPAIDISGLGAKSATQSQFIIDDLNHTGGVPTAGLQYTNTKLYTDALSYIATLGKNIRLAPGSGGSTGGMGTGFVVPQGGGGAGSIAAAGGAGGATSSAGNNAGGNSAGGGGAGGSSNASRSVPADGGRGGGALYIECGGALNFTSTVYAKGLVGPNNSDDALGGGGGGAGGMVLVIYKTLTANSSTIDTSGGNGGNSGVRAGGAGGSSNGGVVIQYL